ncbi:MAG: adenylate/guanylate cyclase domain-containing protein [Gilvibacter sp.]
MNAQKELEALNEVWLDKTQPDSVRADALDNYIWYGFVNTKPEQAIALCDTLFEFAQKTGLKKYMGTARSMQGSAYANTGNYPSGIESHELSFRIREENGDKRGMSSSLMNMGNIYNRQGYFAQALEHYQRSLTLKEEIGHKSGIANILVNIGTIYYEQLDYDLALDYYNRGLVIQEEIGDKEGLSYSLGNIGNIYLDQAKYPEAMDYYNQCLKIHEELEDNIGITLALINIGNIYRLQAQYPQALDYYSRAYDIAESIQYNRVMANSLTNTGLTYLQQNKNLEAVEACHKSLKISKAIMEIDLQKRACECLYQAYKTVSNDNMALAYHEQLVVLNDSIFNEENTKRLTQLEMQYDFDKKEAARAMEQEKKDVVAAQELKRKNLERNGFMAGFGIVFLFAGVFFFQRNRIGKERKKSDKLLMNILPKEVAEELKNTGEAATKKYENVSILFTDFKGFTALVASIPATKLVEELNHLFGRFDDIMDEFGIEKIETIGDAYMAACGLPKENADHALKCVQAAQKMIAFLDQRNLTNDIQWNMRVGIHSGPVVAGVVGKKKFAYDLFGDSVNTASRMESNGEPGKINISHSTYALLKDEQSFSFENRGKILAKGKGDMKMYFVESN